MVENQLHSSVGREQGRHETLHSTQIVSVDVESWREERTGVTSGSRISSVPGWENEIA